MNPAPAEDEALATTLAALSNPVRVAILRQLRTPRVLSDIRVLATEPDEQGSAARPLSRQAVRQHLDRLMEVGIVARTSESATSPYTVDHRRIFATSEDLRALAALRPADDPEGHTETLDRRGQNRPAQGPRLALVRGLGEGAVYPLDAGASWVIGRRRDAQVPLDYDPFVSSENARVQKAEGAYTLEDLPGSRNGTTLNFRPLKPGERARLKHGDLVGVGRSALLYWDD